MTVESIKHNTKSCSICFRHFPVIVAAAVVVAVVVAVAVAVVLNPRLLF